MLDKLEDLGVFEFKFDKIVIKTVFTNLFLI